MTEGTGIGPLQIVRRYVRPQQDDLSFSVEISPPSDMHEMLAFQANIYAVLDVISEAADREEQKIQRAAEREKLKEDIALRRKALEVEKKAPVEIDHKIEITKANRMAYIATRDALRAKNPRRVDTGPGAHEQKTLDDFDKEIADLIMARKHTIEDLPITEWQIRCLEARLAGEEEPSPPRELESRIAEMSLAA